MGQNVCLKERLRSKALSTHRANPALKTGHGLSARTQMPAHLRSSGKELAPDRLERHVPSRQEQ